ncbi:hexaprenyldihydroxybenzoate methyltransferase mitochondrial [Phtheirospermum japonicum]|uniref:Ubiquinone biosynthesis O-methyltransferase, mitochondrial n=1 Tax=Phtheirospermum japonicum TaxID=374723 RepID=A0A830BM48_9LAMI|nr:hexaprenyldihydroxybenzoate methyltransferase mitochondrial [Phtheirospermum japonicum]
MVPKHLLTRILNLTRPALHCPRPTNLCAYPEFAHKLQTRRYSDTLPPPPASPSSAPPPSPAAPVSTPPLASNLHSKSSLNEAELKKFAAIADTWWDAEGPFKPLHVMNPTRLAFIRSTLCRHFGDSEAHLFVFVHEILENFHLAIIKQWQMTLLQLRMEHFAAHFENSLDIKDPHCTRPFEGLKFVDVGCGGGILSEPLARMGATVTGVDAVEKNIKIAQLHADLDPLTSSIDYICTTAEKLVEEQRKFDAVLALEVIEHVADPAEFCKSLSALTSLGGATVISTINRSMRAYATAIIVAEYVLHWLPRGTHQWSSFLTPEELVLILERASISIQEMAGFVYDPLTGRWSLSDDISVNFIAYGTKNSE